MRRSPEKKVIGGFFLVLVLLAVIRFISYEVATDFIQSRDRVDRRREMLADIASLYSHVQDAETSQRGFLLTGRDDYLAPYALGERQWPGEISALANRLREDQTQVALVGKLGKLISEKFAEMDHTIATRRKSGFNPAVEEVLSDRGKGTMDEIRTVVREMTLAQRDRLSRDAEAVAQTRRRSLWVYTGLTLFDFILLGGGFVLIRAYSSGRRQAQQAIALQLAFIRAIASSLGEGVYAVDKEGKLTFMNPAAERMLGWRQEELLGKKAHELVHHAPVDERAANRERSSGSIIGSPGEILTSTNDVLCRKDGESFPAASTSSPIYLDGELIGTVFAFRDITQQKRGEQDLRRAKETAESASKLKSLFLANMSHELRTPLNAIIGYSEMMLEEAGPSPEPQQIADLKKIHQAGQQLLMLINDILDLSKIEAGKVSIFPELFDLPTMIREVSATLKPMIGVNQNTLVIECPEDLGRLHADISKIRQCLFNLLANGLKFTSHGQVTLRAARAPELGREWIAITVSDTGIGMTEAQIKNLFQAFVQAEASTSSKYGGTGLGLAISRQFCRMMGGDLTVQSEPGKGTTFTMMLPVLAAPEETGEGGEPKPGEEGVERPAVAKAAGRVLVIDDDPAVRDLLGRNLIAQGYEVRAASTGDEGLREAREWKPHAITLDVLMPEMDGWSVLRTLKSDPEIADIPVIMMSIVGEQNRALGVALGAAEFMTKPVDRTHLARLLDKYRSIDRSSEVLVVEDDGDVRELLVRTLAGEGWMVREAENGRAALERIAEQKPGVILLDLMMPEMDGFEFLFELRKHEQWRSIPVVVVTARDLSAEDHDRLRGNVQRILAKASYTREDLLAEVSEMVKACCG